MQLSTVLSAIAWLLVAGAVAVFGCAFVFGGSIYDALKNAVPAGVLLALSGHLFTQAKTLTDAEEKRSLFNLEGFRTAYDHAQSLITDGNNNRAKWIEAARCLAQGNELANEVSVKTHQRALELDRLRYRGIFDQLFRAKSAEFFNGVPALNPTLDDTAKAPTAPGVEDGRRLVSTNHALDEASIFLIWSAAQWPKDYDDPMYERFSAEQKTKLQLLYPELHRFLDHKE
jgi:hypothetical protein